MPATTKPTTRSFENLNVGCGPHRAPPPWWNIDRVERPGDTPTAPDEVVPDGPLPYADGSIKRLYAGHIMEHMPIVTVRSMLLPDWRRVLAPGAEIAIVGPDVNRALAWFKSGMLTRDQLWERMEHGSTTSIEAWRRLYGSDVDPYTHHYWNCIPERVMALLESAGFEDVREVPLISIHNEKWPLVGLSEDQFAVRAHNPA